MRRILKKLPSIVLAVFVFMAFVFAGIARVQAAAGPNLPSPAQGGPSSDAVSSYLDSIGAGLTTGAPNLTTTVADCGFTDTTTQKVSGDGALCSILKGLIVLMAGTTPSGSSQANSGSGHQTALYYPGAIGTTLNMTGIALANPPVSSREYVADVMQNMQHPFVQSAYAQGIGFSSLSPVLGLWKVFRDVAYFFFVVIFVVVGFLIMIRSKIGSQAAVTAQQMLPKLVVSLILVTFSYAIAGLMIDIMYLIIYLMIGIFSSASGGKLTTLRLQDIAFVQNIFSNGFGIIGNLVGGISQNIGDIVASLTNAGLGGTGIADFAGKLVGGVTNVIMVLVLTIVILVSLFRTFFALVNAYIAVFFSVIFAPIQLLFGALPGQNTFGKWIKGLFENLLVFPALILLIFIAYFFTLGINTTSSDTGFSAPQLGSNQGTNGVGAYQGLLALGAILAMPEVLKVTKGLMKGELGVGVEDLRKNFEKGIKPATLVGGTLGGAGVGFAGGALLGLNSAIKEPGTLKERAGRLVRNTAVGTAAGAVGGGFVSSGEAWKLAKTVGRQTTGAVINVVAGEEIQNALDRFDPSKRPRPTPPSASNPTAGRKVHNPTPPIE
ncbi:hypothetical protein C5B42_01805 [Candidatus Cerribacteria bacterium 'Amazon FNV 2010 28 9']|uniref:Uncharacterized protein n=1 Tax=Candidatus Cerribacteria bacterium 'Amazon FNV 2010 28 9' TaxID=2081795 RepID=A0A317JP92_9BACT|nr:MAG: hypothetical protein C5B42_01805 [Candidatus Cerribacteria bacterium 'Amazon FNV 2010 28 9']